VTRDYAYFIENRLRGRYGLDGVPLIIDFVARGERVSGAHHREGTRRARSTRGARTDPGAPTGPN
jgi:hypothetical protein